MFFDLLLLFSSSFFLSLILRRFHIPNFGAFLITGFLAKQCGGFNLNLEMLSKSGILLLLFGVGLEMSFNGMKSIKKFFFPSLSIMMAVLFLSFLIFFNFFSIKIALVLSVTASLSSTAIVLHSLADSKQMHTDTGRLSIMLLILQDVVAVLVLIFIQPFHLAQFSLGVGFFVLILIVFSFIIGFLLNKIYKYHKESFILAIFTLILCFCVIAQTIGLSIEIGAMCAGMLLANSKFTVKIESSIETIKEILMMIFFIEIGTSMNADILIQNYQIICLGFLFIVLAKVLGTFLGGVSFIKNKQLIVVSLISCNMSETGFLIIRELFQQNLINEKAQEIILLIFLLITFSSPVFLLISKLIERHKISKHIDYHVDIVVVGVNLYSEKIISRFKQLDIAYVIVDESIDNVVRLKSLGYKAVLGNFFKNSAKLHLQNANVVLFAGEIAGKTENIVKYSEIFEGTKFIVLSHDLRGHHFLKTHNIHSISVPSSEFIDQIIDNITPFVLHEKIHL